MIYFDDQTGFKPMHYIAEENENYVFGIGKGHWITDPIIERNLGKEDIGSILRKAYTAAANETCGGKLTYYELSLDECTKHSEKIPDIRSIKRYDDYFSEHKEQSLHGLGDGVTPTSGKAIESKYHGGYKISYGQSNTGRERGIDLNDQGF